MLIIGIQAELQAAFKEGDCVKKKIKLQEIELDKLRTKLNESEEDFNSKYSKILVNPENSYLKKIPFP